tara:strand:- start:2890 stop:3267 length:378 start_codon:yes stop_codon:yes gene_type:complete
MGFLDDILDGVLPEVVGLFRDVAVVLKNEGGAYNPLTGYTDGVDETVSVFPTPFADYNVREVDGTTIQRGDKKCLVASISLGSFQVQPNATVLVDGTTEYLIISTKAVSGGDREGALILQLRGSE